MSPITKARLEHPRELLNLLLAAVLFVSPWVLGFTDEAGATTTAWGTGLVIAVLSISALFVEVAKWEDIAGLVLGFWTVVAPWAVGFAAVMAAQWTHVGVGILLIALTGWEVWSDISHKPALTT